MRIGEVLTMAEYVTKEQVIDWYRPYGQTDEPIPFETLVSDLRDMKTADVAPVRHGMWETIDASTWRWSHDGAKPVHRVKYRHNECGRVVQRKEPYCPNCGAIMDLEG